jgi:hypothetical protein
MSQGDFGACKLILARMGLSREELQFKCSEVHRLWKERDPLGYSDHQSYASKCATKQDKSKGGKSAAKITVESGRIDTIGFGKNVDPVVAGRKGGQVTRDLGKIGGFGKNSDPRKAAAASVASRSYYKCTVTGRIAQKPTHARYNKENYPHNLIEV